MVLVTKKCLWDAIVPTMRFWVLTPQIEKLERFLFQFRNLTLMQSISAIWQMSHPEDLLLINDVKVQAIHQCVRDLPYLCIMQNEMQQDEQTMLEYRFSDIKREIKDILEHEESSMQSHIARRLLSMLVQSAPTEIMTELLYHYDDAWQKTNCRLSFNGVPAPRYISTPIVLSIEEQTALLLLLRSNEDVATQKLLVVHDELVNYIMTRRQEEIKELMIDVKHHLIFLHQQRLLG